jgi:hypothetical protein
MPGEVKLEEVFKVAGIPTHTFVTPSSYGALVVALRTPGRGVVVEGPSGIGKTTAVTKAIEELNPESAVEKLSARRPEDVEFIAMLPEIRGFGIVVVDDFHRLPQDLRESLADLLKVMADNEVVDSKLVTVGINEAGQSLIQHAPDLVHRIETIKFEVEPPQRIDELIARGEAALNISLEARDQVTDAAHGSFYLAQILCHGLCIEAGVQEQQAEKTPVRVPYATVRRKVIEREERRFGKTVRQFARGNKFRPSGRAPYLHILRWLAEADSWSISLQDELARHSTERISVGQVVDKGFLAYLIEQGDIRDLLHLDPVTRVLSVEDPQLVFYLRNLDWGSFIRDCGFTKVDYEYEYDVALSFAGEDRPFAERLYDHLSDADVAVFYDQAEQHRILAADVEEYLGPIYRSRARFVVAVLGERYGEKRWTIFESEQFKDRIERGEVIPIWSTKIPPSAFDATRAIGGMQFDPDEDLDLQARSSAKLITAKLDDAAQAERLPLTEATVERRD